MNEEQIITEIIADSGMACSQMIKAIWKAREGDFTTVDQLRKQAEESLNQAHVAQTQLIQRELNGEGVPLTLLMIHAQDHLMTTISLKEMADELIKEIAIRLGKEDVQ